MTPNTVLGLALGIPLAVIAVVIIVLAATGVFSSAGSSVAIPTASETQVPDTIREERLSNVRVLGLTSALTVDFDLAFATEPTSDLVTVVNPDLLGTPTAVANLTPTSNTQATISVTVGNFPATLPLNKLVGDTMADPAAMGIFHDSLGNVWVSVRNPGDESRSQYTKNASGIDANDFAPLTDGTENASDTVYSTFWHESPDGNVVQYSCYATLGGQVFAGLYGPVTGTTLPTSCTGFNNARAQAMQAVAMPGDPARVFIPFHVVPTATWIHESKNGGKDFEAAVAINSAVGTFYPTMAFFDNVQALVAFTTDAFEVEVTYFDGGTGWTDRGTISGVANVASSAQVVLLEGTIAVFYAQDSPSRNAFVVFSTDNNLGSAWSAPMDLGVIADGTIRDIRAGSSNGVPWVVCHNNSNLIQGRFCRQSNGQAIWSDLHTIGESTSDINCLGTEFSDAGVLLSSANSFPKLVYNFVPTEARIGWAVEGPGIELAPDPGRNITGN